MSQRESLIPCYRTQCLLMTDIYYFIVFYCQLFLAFNNFPLFGILKRYTSFAALCVCVFSYGFFKFSSRSQISFQNVKALDFNNKLVNQSKSYSLNKFLNEK